MKRPVIYPLTLKSLGMLLMCVWLITGCEAQITAHVMATLTAAAPVVTPTPTIPPLPAPTATLGGDPKDYTGTFTYGFEVMAFKSCNSDELWWLNGDVDAMIELRTRYAALTKKMEPVHVQLRGLISERGNYGHMGSYQREFYLQDVWEVRAKEASDCE
jgi:hypothetical protein